MNHVKEMLTKIVTGKLYSQIVKQVFDKNISNLDYFRLKE